MQLSGLHAIHMQRLSSDKWAVDSGQPRLKECTSRAHLNDLASKGLHVLARAENAVHQNCSGRSLARLNLAPPYLLHRYQLCIPTCF